MVFSICQAAIVLPKMMFSVYQTVIADLNHWQKMLRVAIFLELPFKGAFSACLQKLVLTIQFTED